MLRLVREPYDLVFDRRAVAGAGAANLAAVHRGPMQVGADHLVNLLVRVRDPAGQLLDAKLAGQERKRLRIVVARLLLRLRIIDRAAVQPRRRAGLEPRNLEAQAGRAPGSVPRSCPPRPARPASWFHPGASRPGGTSPWSESRPAPGRPPRLGRSRRQPATNPRCRPSADRRPCLDASPSSLAIRRCVSVRSDRPVYRPEPAGCASPDLCGDSTAGTESP